MAVNLSGRLLDDAGNGINGATVTVYPVGSGVATTSTTTAASGGEDGWWSFSSLANNDYRVVATQSGRARETSGAVKLQVKEITVGQAKVVVDNTGLIAVASGGDLTIAGVSAITTISTSGNISAIKSGNTVTLTVDPAGGWDTLYYALTVARGAF